MCFDFAVYLLKISRHLLMIESNEANTTRILLLVFLNYQYLHAIDLCTRLMLAIK